MHHTNKIFLFLIIFLISLLKISYSDEIMIESEELVITNEPLTTTFVGNVYAFDNEIKIWSDKILILYTETESKIDQIKCFGNSKLVRESQEIISENITYFAIDKKIYAEGDITLTQDENVMKGNELSVDLAKSTSIMIGNKNNKVTVKINNNE